MADSTFCWTPPERLLGFIAVLVMSWKLLEERACRLGRAFYLLLHRNDEQWDGRLDLGAHSYYLDELEERILSRTWSAKGT